MPVQVRIEIDRETSRKINKLSPATVNQAVQESIKGYAAVLQRQLVSNSPVLGKGRTGNFARSWMTIPGDSRIDINNNARYSRFVEFDTRPHIILPRFKKVLRWRTGGRGPISAFRPTAALASRNFIFSKKVNHPGTKGQRIFPRSVTQTLQKYADILKEKINMFFA